MKSAQRRCASARRIVSAVGRSLVCGHHRGACAGSSPAWSWSRGCFAEMSAGGYGKMNHQQLEFYWSVRMWQRFKEVVSHHSSLWVNPGWASWVLPITSPYFSFQSIFVNFINRMTRSRLSRSKLDYFIYRATFPPWAAPGDRGEKKKTQDQGCSVCQVQSQQTRNIMWIKVWMFTSTVRRLSTTHIMFNTSANTCSQMYL